MIGSKAVTKQESFSQFEASALCQAIIVADHTLQEEHLLILQLSQAFLLVASHMAICP